MRHNNLFRYGLFNTELTEINNGWLLTERTIPILGIEYPTTTYFPTLKKVMLHLIKCEEKSKKRAKKHKGENK